ncbi:MAG: ankyrin repeat domain-containing protein [Actinomycetota bacterium]
MISPEHRLATIDAIRRLQSPGGGFADAPGGAPELGATLSALKVLGFLGVSPPSPDAVGEFVDSHFDAEGACAGPDGKPSVIATAGGLILLQLIGARDVLARRAGPSVDWMVAHAAIREEHFMTVAAVEECHLARALPGSAAFFHGLEQADGTFGPSVLANGIDASALLRLKEPLAAPAAVTKALLGGQTAEGGFSDTGGPAQGKPDLWTTYCVMRALDLLHEVPSRQPLASWVLAKALPGGGFGAAPDGPLSAGITYQCLEILDWIATPVLDAARTGDVAAVSEWLRAGGDPDVRDLTGWTPLMAAAVRGQTAVVELLVSDDVPGGKQANPDLRLPEADALPVFWAGQGGDTQSVAAILRRRPQQLFDVSSVNGHTVLLQAAFFGTQRHYDLARWLLDNTASILCLDPADSAGLADAHRRLMEACNVRGYTAQTMGKLWGNQAMAALFAGYDNGTDGGRAAYLSSLLARIARPAPTDPAEAAAQQLTDRCVQAITDGFTKLNAAAADASADLGRIEDQVMSAISVPVEASGFEINRLGGPLSETPVIVAVTGVDADERVSAFRQRLTRYLLDHGADPDLPELHPMAVDAVIRSAVLNHFECLQIIASAMKPLAFAAALNERPMINGQTALDDTVHRALTATDATAQSHLDQIRWAIAHGARTDIEDFTGTSVADRARLALDDPILKARAPEVLEALGLPADR